MMSFEVKGGVEAVKILFDNLSLFTLAQSLGGVESLISHPSTMTHAGMEIEAQIAAGISQSLVRISIGIEDIEDILDDLDQGLVASQNITQQNDIGNNQLAQHEARQVTEQTQANKLSASDLNPALAATW